MIIETPHARYEIFLEMIQFEITGRCNMRCQHCRAWQDPQKDLTLSDIEKVLDFAIPEACSEMRFTISGGEPFLHPQIFEILELIKRRVDDAKKIIHHAVITTNGSLLTEEKIKRLENIGFRELYIQTSIDSADPKKHNTFRSFPNAFERAIKSVRLLAKSKLITSIRATITPQTLSEIEDLILLAINCGAKRIGFGSVIPTGKGRLNRQLILTPPQKKLFLEKITEYRQKYSSKIRVSTEDPLKFAVCTKTWDFGDFDYQNPSFLGGCSAGIITINVLSDGTITPCSMLLKPIVNIKNKTPKEVLKTYTSSKIIHNLVERKIKGKCNVCDLKRLCGGCRAAAEGIIGDYLAEDPTCWRKLTKA
jgi:radical SAM protein with 4Fe4S-binding SPASM domain